MKKPKPPKAKAPQKQPQSHLPPPPPPQPHLGLLRRVLHTWWGKTVASLAVLGTVQGGFSTFEFFRGLVQDTRPDIQIAGDGKTPFALPLVVKNKSHIFAMTDVKWRCEVVDAKTANGGHFENNSIISAPKGAKINPGDTEIFPCNLISGVVVTTAVMVPVLEYKTLWFSRAFSEKKFTWYGASDPPRWIASGAP
jgi:hypothetical protein